MRPATFFCDQPLNAQSVIQKPRPSAVGRIEYGRKSLTPVPVGSTNAIWSTYLNPAPSGTTLTAQILPCPHSQWKMRPRYFSGKPSSQYTQPWHGEPPPKSWIIGNTSLGCRVNAHG